MDGAPGPETVVEAGSIQKPAAFERRFTADGIVRSGELTAISFHGQPFDFVWLIIALDADPAVTYLPEVLGAFHPGGSPLFFKFRGLLNASGEKTLSVTPSATGLDFVPIYEQALMYNQIEGFVASNPRYISFID